MSRSVGGSASGRAVTWAWNLAHLPPPAPVRAEVARHVLDTLGCAVAAARAGSVDGLLSVSHRTVGGGPATLLDGSGSVAVEDAALGNGLLMHCLDFDDRHAASGVHVGAVVLPAVLAVAEQVDATGMDLLGAFLAGAEVATRLGSAAQGELVRHGFDPTPVVGAPAAALAVAWLRELDAHAAQHAVAIACSLAAGSLESAPAATSTARLHPGLAARSALLAADLAAAGATGPPLAWEGPDGLFASYADLEVDPDDLVDDLGRRWEAESISVKRYPCHDLTHSSLDAARSLARDGIAPDDVEDLVAVVHPATAGVVCQPFPAGHAASHPHGDPRGDPDSPEEARASLAWCVAAGLVDGNVDLRTFDPVGIRRPDVLALASRVRCEVAEHLHGPAAAQPGHLRVTLRDGEELAVMAPGGVGGPDHPVEDGELVAKFVLNCGDHPDAPGVAAQVLALEDQPSATSLAAAVADLAR
jgi:2-methylcitrate dehydratase PrpD